MKHVLLVLLLLDPVLVACGEQVDRQGAAGPAREAQPQGLKPNVITWRTASEQDSFGYDVYRGLAEDGPFVAINAEVIPGAGTTDLPQRYEFIDASIEPDTTYWYYIESISLAGERKRITPIYASNPKPAVAEESP